MLKSVLDTTKFIRFLQEKILKSKINLSPLNFIKNKNMYFPVSQGVQQSVIGGKLPHSHYILLCDFCYCRLTGQFGNFLTAC